MPKALLAAAVIALAAAGAAPGAERMYQWTDPATGHTHFSGEPPAWYRRGDGPRVLVFEDGRLIDDTARTVDDATGARLRAEAAAPPADTDGEHHGAGATAGQAEDAAPTADDEAAQVRRLKALIAAWEALRTAEAKAALGDPGQAPSAGAEDGGGEASPRTGDEHGPADPSAAARPAR